MTLRCVLDSLAPNEASEDSGVSSRCHQTRAGDQTMVTLTHTRGHQAAHLRPRSEGLRQEAGTACDWREAEGGRAAGAC